MFEFLDDAAKSIGNFFSVDNSYTPETPLSSPDAIKTGSALSNLGFFGNNGESEFSLPNSVKAFQDANGLKVDGVINKGGPTENAISNALQQNSISTANPLESSTDALPDNVTVSQPASTKPDQKSFTASASFGPKPKAPAKPKIDPLTGTVDPLANAPKPNKSMKKAWNDYYKTQEKKAQTTQQALLELMKDPRYQKKDEAYVNHVQKQFKRAYPGEVQYDETGKMIQAKAVIGPDEVQSFSSDTFSPEKMPQTSSYEEKEVPVLKNEKERLESIIEDKPAEFPIENNPDVSGDEKIHEFGWIGSTAVTKHSDTIEKMAKKHNVDPNLLKSVMWAENARGHKFGGNLLGDLTKKSDSPLPMNMNKETGAKLLNKSPDEMYDAANNIEAAAIFLKRLQDRTDNPTPEKLGSMWIYTGRNKTHDWGAFIQRIYDTKPWLDKDDEHGPERETFGP